MFLRLPLLYERPIEGRSAAVVLVTPSGLGAFVSCVEGLSRRPIIPEETGEASELLRRRGLLIMTRRFNGRLATGRLRTAAGWKSSSSDTAVGFPRGRWSGGGILAATS